MGMYLNICAGCVYRYKTVLVLFNNTLPHLSKKNLDGLERFIESASQNNICHQSPASNQKHRKPSSSL